MLVRRISIEEAQQNILEIFRTVQSTEEAVIVEREGKPLAVVVSPEEYEQLQWLREQRAWATVDRVRERHKDKTEAEVMADVTAEVEAVRREAYERKQQKTHRSG